jgi:murein DD-endopeptidase MepM/ murein hydrolase activator NlpD
MKTGHRQTFGRRSGRALALPSLGWKSAGVLALLCSGVAWASLPRPVELSSDEQRQWQALGVKPLSSGGASGMQMVATDAVAPVDFVPARAAAPLPQAEPAPTPAAEAGPLRIRGRVGDGLYWSLRAAGASPQVAAQYLAALATEIDVGEVAPNDGFDMVLGRNRELLYAGLDRAASTDLQLVRWNRGGRSQWVDAANADRPGPVESGLMMPANGPITSYFGNRYHPILHFTRFHAGVDIGAGWGSPIVAAADGQVAAAGWAGGYGREVQIAHGGGTVSIYGHMSEIVAQPGSFVRRGQLIGYVGSSGLSTGPHLHFEVRQGGTPVNPLGVRFASAPVVDTQLAASVKARLKALLSVGAKRS